MKTVLLDPADAVMRMLGLLRLRGWSGRLLSEVASSWIVS